MRAADAASPAWYGFASERVIPVDSAVTGWRPAAGGGRWIDVAPERLAGWLADFDARHQFTRSVYAPELASFEAADGAVAECHPPFPPLPEAGAHEGLVAEPLLAHACRDRVVGVLLVR